MGDWKLAHVHGQCPTEHLERFNQIIGPLPKSEWSEARYEENERRRACDEVPLWLTQLAHDGEPFGLGGHLHIAPTIDGRFLAFGFLNEKSPEPANLTRELEYVGLQCPGIHMVVHVTHTVHDHEEPTLVDYCLELLPSGVVHEVRASMAMLGARSYDGIPKYGYMLMQQLHGMDRTMEPLRVPSFQYAELVAKQRQEVYTWWLVDLVEGALYDHKGQLITQE